MRNRKQLVWRIADLAESYCTDLEPQHILISGAEGSGKTFMIEKLAEEFTARGFLIVKYLYPHSNIVGTESLIKDLGYLLGKQAVVLIDDFDKLLLSMTKGEQKKLITFFSNMHSPFLVATSTGLSEEFSKRYPLFDQFFYSFKIPSFEKEDIEDLLGEDIYDKVKGNPEFQEIITRLGGNLNYIKFFASVIYPNYGTEDCLDIVIDENERFFSYKFSTLPGVQQRALYGLARAGEIATAADVQRESGLSATNTSSALYRLEKRGVITKAGGKKRSVEYRITDYLFGKWIVG